MCICVQSTEIVTKYKYIVYTYCTYIYIYIYILCDKCGAMK